MQSTWMALALVGVAREARAQEAPPPSPADTPAAPPVREAPPIGGRGRVVLDLAGLGGPVGGPGQLGGIGGVAGPISFSWREGDTSIRFSPSADVFVTERLSLGARASVGWTKYFAYPGGEVIAGVAPRIGYALPITSTFAFWPRLGVGADFGGPGQMYFADADAGFVVRVSKHLLIDLGPVLTVRRQYFNVYEDTVIDGRARVALRLDF